MAASYSTVAQGSTSTGSGTLIDCNHPYYLNSSDHPGILLVTVTLSEHNYSQWSRSMKIALSSKLKLGFNDGSYAKPASNSNLLLYWNRCNDIVTSWILNTVSPEIRQSVMFMNCAKDIRNDLAARFAHVNVPKLFNLKRELAHLTQGTMSISAYFTKFRSLNDELESLSEMPKCSCTKCTCDINQRLTKFLRANLLAQFLMGLNETFTVTRGHILMITPAPSLSEAYGILLQEEQQREKLPVSIVFSENSAMAVKQYNPYGNKTNKSAKKQVSDVSTLYCDYCQTNGHTREKCFCLNGFPDWHKFYGKPKPVPRHLRGKPQVNATSTDKSVANVHSAETSSVFQPGTSSDNSTNFSDSQYKQILQMIQTSFKDLNSSGAPAVGWGASANTVHAAGPFFEDSQRDW